MFLYFIATQRKVQKLWFKYFGKLLCHLRKSIFENSTRLQYDTII